MTVYLKIGGIVYPPKIVIEHPQKLGRIVTIQHYVQSLESPCWVTPRQIAGGRYQISAPRALHSVERNVNFFQK